jgi:Pup amidohydrolase
MASSPKVLDRLMGLETEYAVYSDTADSTTNPLSSSELFDSLCVQIAKKLPLVDSDHADQKFLANGGAISFEAAIGLRGELQGLVEGATPECRSPASLVAYQLAQDELFEEAIREISPRDSNRLLKNSADPSGHLYGVQENYEIEIARGWRLWGLRGLLVLILPVFVAYWVMASIWLAAIQFTGWIVAICKSRSGMVQQNPTPAPEDASRTSVGGNVSANSFPPPTDGEIPRANFNSDWARKFRGTLLRSAIMGLRTLHAPLALVLSLVIRTFVMRPQLQRLAPFFATRIILDGAGHLDCQGKFWLGAKASACDGWIGLGGYWGKRPVFVFGHWLRTLCAPGTRPWRTIGRLFRSRQRVQLALGDSCMSPMSQYLRAGITSLLLDWVEQTVPATEIPKLVDSFQGLKSVARDELLIAKLPDVHGTNWTALEIQYFYLDAIKDFLQQSWQVPSEAWRIVRLWQDSLDSLQAAKHDPQVRQTLLGRVDWLSKLWMLQQVAADAAWGIRKKVDIRFHEMSDDGYYRKLVAVAGKYPLISAEKIRHAKRIPPSDTIASKRGYLIREFSSSNAEVTAGWDFVRMVEGDQVTYYDLANDFWNSSKR